ncbi:MAG: ABC transporter permease [Blastocatellia bacterium]
MQTLIQDLRYGVRMLLKKPGFTLVAVITLALGIGANTAIFSVINAVLLKPLSYAEPDRLLQLFAVFPDEGSDPEIKTVSWPDFVDIKSQSQSFTDMAAVDGTALNLTGGNETERLRVALVSASLFELLGVNPALGRNFLDEEDQPNGAPVIILSHGLWQRRFGADSGILGQAITLNRSDYTVVGVMPRGFKMPSDLSGGNTDAWMPITPFAIKRSRGQHRFEAYARLKPEATFDSAREDMSVIAGQLERQYQSTNKDKGAGLMPLGELVVRDSRKMLLVMLGAVGFVLAVACANVANLMLARAASRSREIAIRTTLGAGRWRIIRQLLTESLLLSLVGGLAGLLLALWGTDAVVALHPGGLPRLDEVRMDWQVLSFTLVVSLVTGLLSGLAPALQASKSDQVTAMKEGSTQSSSRRLRNLLVVAETALALVLLIGAGLLIKSFWRLQQVDAGIKPDHLLTFQVSLPRNDYPEAQQKRIFFENLLERAAAIPGVQSVGASHILPLSGAFSCDSFMRDDRPLPPDDHPCAEIRLVTPDYFLTLGIGLTRGRAFTERDNGAAGAVVMINEAMAEKFWPGEDPIGKRLTPDSGATVSREIVGVVRDIKHFGLDMESKPEYYIPYQQDPWSSALTIAMRTTGDPASLSQAVRSEVRSLDSSLPVTNLRTMKELVDRSVAEPRFRTLLLGVFAGVALLLSMLGIYGVMSWSVAQRTREVGVRMALGAAPADILRLLIGQGMIVALVGVGIGISGAFMLTRVLASFLFEVNATDLLTFVSISVLLLAAAMLACYVPARRATRIDPMVALRYE